MKIFACPNCKAPVFFDSSWCAGCGSALAYTPDQDEFVEAASVYRCANALTVESCNWATTYGEFWCPSCALDIDHEPHDFAVRFQAAKRRALRQLRVMRIEHRGVVPPLRFSLRQGSDDIPVTIGHANGLITLDTAESDPSHLTDLRTRLGEPYRTPLGHVRHELGHWYWQAYIDGGTRLDRFRELFGDERMPYTEALAAHYLRGDDGSWRAAFISHYASSHPWEDFAESFAHYLHLADSLETARAHGLWPRVDASIGFAEVYADWVRLTVLLNELNRSMGLDDAYPFVPARPAVEKIAFVRQTIVG